MRKLLLFTTCLLAGVLSLTSCSKDETPGFGSIYGIVTDSSTSQPVYGVTVVLSPGNLSTTTGEDGHYEFVDLEAGQYKVQVQASNYQANSKQITVNAGSSATGDITITPNQSISGLWLSSTALNFDTSYNELTLTLTNTGNSGSLSWIISGINVSWLSISPQQGEIEMGKSSDIKVIIDRSSITSSQSTYFIINAAGGSQSVSVSVSTQTDSGGNSGDSSSSGDYSSATVTSCDSRVGAAIVSCERSGSAVVFTYTLTNNGLGTVNDWRIYTPQALSVISGGTKSVITDNLGNEYSRPTMTFRSESTAGGTYILSTTFPEGVTCQGTVTVTGVPTTATKLNALIGVYAYNSSANLATTQVTFNNVPIH